MENSAKSEATDDVAASGAATSASDSATTSAGDGGGPPPTAPALYTVGEFVLATHNGLCYKAKVEEVEFDEDEWRYFIHYWGWNRSWDEWVGVDRLMKFTEENVEKMMKPDEKHKRDKNVKDTSGKKQLSDSTDAGKKKRKRSTVKEKDIGPLEKHVNIYIPLILKKQLIDDCEFINQMGKLVKLPRSPTIDEILIKYQDYRRSKDGVVSKSVEEMLKGLRAYFEKALPVLLLYNKERQQYEEAIARDVSLSKVYGAEHLLRLFVKLPSFLHNLNVEEVTLTELQHKLNDFLKFLKKNHRDFFQALYYPPEDSETRIKKEMPANR